MKLEIIKTKDGSHSLLVPEINETYHSTHGALTESEYVFIQQGLEHYVSTNNVSEINILEIGFGTGLNALLTCLAAETGNTRINYYSLETNPVDPAIIRELNYHELIDAENAAIVFENLHASKWNELVGINDNFCLKKIEQQLQKYLGEKNQFDLVYFDAFAPSRQPEMWELSLFEGIFGRMKPKGVLVTYCAQGQFKRDLKSCGFEVERLPGPPGKAEMTRAIKV
jgi:tRNA U34 5-methylaminomethyl-2-thiouridine-forming methyltransferase MnmC